MFDNDKTFNIIAESLALFYDVLYLIDCNSHNYAEFISDKSEGDISLNCKGEDFFADLAKNVPKMVYPADQKVVLSALKKENLLGELETQRQFTTDYRLTIDGKTRYSRLTAMRARGNTHLIIGVEYIGNDLRIKPLKHSSAPDERATGLNDELTGAKNETAFYLLERTVQRNILIGLDYLPFGILSCDINDLSKINEAKGQAAADEYIKSSYRLIRKTFTHSAVYRIGIDKFAVFLSSVDYENRNVLLTDFQEQAVKNLKTGSGPVVASGVAVFDKKNDRLFTEVLERADIMMSENKKWLKQGAPAKASYGPDSLEAPVPPERKKKIDSLFDAFSVVAEGTYIFVCDMRYDYSRWSRAAVSCFGLPSEYMFNAGKIWESHIHPDDVKTYHTGIDDIFSGNAVGHDMQYRARKLNGEYNVCTCRGVVIRDKNEQPEFFCGSIRNHGLQGHIDPLTGLRNLYGFFEDMEAHILRNNEIHICMIGIGKFSEINEVYGYHFGNIVLQKFGRHLLDDLGSAGSVYRLDGTKFAIISTSIKPGEMSERYENLRTYFRQGFLIDDISIILDLNSGLLTVNNFSMDYQTVYACLNFAYGESKVRRQGDMVEFYNDLNDENKHRIEKLNAIRGSVTKNYQGFYLLYQPVVDAVTEKITGAEALLRWKNDEYGMVPPDHFIPILEKDPIFFELGQWILKNAMLGAKQLLEKHPGFIINVNLSYTQLEKPNFVDMVLETIEEVQFPPENLCLEITERCKLLDMELLKNVIVNLRGRGIKIALDDFGTGFSSMGLLKTLPFDVIKIDRSFVIRIEDDTKERTFIKTFAEVSSTYGAKVCVEGIETAGMRHILLNYHINSLQGYYYSRPIELDKLIKLSE